VHDCVQISAGLVILEDQACQCLAVELTGAIDNTRAKSRHNLLEGRLPRLNDCSRHLVRVNDLQPMGLKLCCHE